MGFLPLKVVGKTHQGLESILAKEIEVAGGQKVKVGRRAVFFYANQEILYRANLTCSTALRFLVELHTYEAKTDDALYRGAKKVAWEKILSPEMTFAVDSVTYSSFFTHSHYAALRLKDAIVDSFRSKNMSRPNVDTDKPDVRIHLHIANERVNLMLDSSGESLHKRGYRVNNVTAPLNECLAAGLVKLTGWKGQSEFIDPMCGSGTFAIEAALMATNTPVNYRRGHFGFQTWMNYSHELWESIVDKALDERLEIDVPIRASDISGRALEASRNNASAVGMQEIITIFKSDFQDVTPLTQKGTFVVNPPYGERLRPDDIQMQYKALGDHMKGAYSGFSAWILSSNLNALKFVGLRPSSKLTVFNGALQTKFLGYDLYQGSKKAKKQN